MNKTLGDYLILLISVVGSFASTIAFGIYFSPALNNQGWTGVLFLGLLCFFFLGYIFYLISSYRKKVRYASIFEEINVGFTELHSIDKISEPSIELIVQKIGFLCDHLSNAFTKVNGSNVGVCVKFLNTENQRAIVTTLARDRKSKANNRKTGTADKTKHYIDLNSDFDFIYSNFDDDNTDTTSYYEPKLPVCRDYKNSRLKSNWAPKNKFWPFNNINRRINWPLPYRSTLVTPIVPLLANEQNKKAIRGYLCVDSNREGMFYEQIDVNILKGICDGLYNKIDTLNKLIKEQDGKKKEC